MEKIISVKKGELLQEAGTYGTKVYIIKKGILRSYIIDQKGKEHIFMFGAEGWYMGEMCPSTERSELFIDAVEDSVVCVEEKNFHRPQVEFRKIIKRVRVLQKRVLLLMSTPAMDRYEDFLKMYPDLVQRVPQRMIASYLGVTPEALSKIKSVYK